MISTFSVKWNRLQQFWLLTEWNPCPFLGDSWGPKGRNSRPTAETGGGILEPPPHQLEGMGSTVSSPRGARGRALATNTFWTKSLQNVSSGRKCRTQFIFLLSTSGPAERLDTTDGTLRFCGTLVEKHCYKWWQIVRNAWQRTEMKWFWNQNPREWKSTFCRRLKTLPLLYTSSIRNLASTSMTKCSLVLYGALEIRF